MKYAVVKYGGKQLKITENMTFKIERQKDVKMDVLAYSDDKQVLIGTPTLSEVKVKAKLEGETRGDKVRVARYKSKSRYHKNKGHKQPLSIVKIESITLGSEKPAKKEETKTKTEEKSVKTASKDTKKPVKASDKSSKSAKSEKKVTNSKKEK